MKTDTKPDTAASEVPENLNSGKKSSHIKQADFFRNLLLGISIILVAGTAIFQLDLMPSVMLGCAVIGFNYYWTVKFVQKLLLERKLFALDLLFILTKFAISVIVLFGALTYLKLPPMGLLIGLSNGEEIDLRVSFKPTATINFEQNTVTREGEAVKLKAKGRHDPCVLPRAVPMVEAMINLVLTDHYLRNRQSRL